MNLKKSLINFIKNLLIENNINKIIIDVHQNLRFYKHYYESENFVITENQCLDNPFWKEAELIIS